MKIKTKNAKNGGMSTVNLALHKNLVLKIPKREVRLDGSEKSYIWRDIMKAATFYF